MVLNQTAIARPVQTSTTTDLAAPGAVTPSLYGQRVDRSLPIGGGDFARRWLIKLMLVGIAATVGYIALTGRGIATTPGSIEVKLHVVNEVHIGTDAARPTSTERN